MPNVYASVPLSGPARQLGRELLRGAELALERATGQPVELLALDTDGDDRDGRAEDAARQAAEDSDAVAYLGDFYSSQVAETAPMLAAARLLQVAPVATYSELSSATLVRLMPHDGVGAAAIADWLVDAGVRELLVVHDHDPYYGVPVGRMCLEAARQRGLAVRSRPVWNQDERPVDDLGEAQAVLYIGVAGSGAVALWHELHAANPDLWLLGGEGLAERWLAEALSPAAAERTRFFLAQRAPLGFYGFEAMALILDAVAEGRGDRDAVVRAARATTDRDSVLGRYSLDEDGLTTTTAYGCLAVEDRELVSAAAASNAVSPRAAAGRRRGRSMRFRG
jgi:branched-chain amino acid transport system substrate-binding protein